MKILIVGAGSTGGYFGGRLAQAGRDVTFLVRPARAERLRATGLQILSPLGDFAVTPRLVTAGELHSACDVVLLTVKAFSLPAAMDDMAPAVGPATTIVPVLNGLRHIDVLASRFGAHSVVGGVCKVSTRLDDEGRIVQMMPVHELAYGELDGSSTARIAALDTAFQGAGFDARLSARILQDLWNKWIMLATLGGVTCLSRGSIGDIESAVGGADFVRAFLGETVSVATAAGFAPSGGVLSSTLDLLTTRGSTLTSSMYRDLQQGDAVEADQIVGDMLARARSLGVATPLLAAAFIQLSVYQRRRGKDQPRP